MNFGRSAPVLRDGRVARPTSTSRRGAWRPILRSVRRKPRPAKQIVAFKVEPELAAVLDAMPNKSEFIRAAVQSRLTSACPLCRGTGIAPFSGIGDELTKLVQQHPLCVCAGCGVKEPRPCHSPGHCETEPRLVALERWGMFFCDACAAEMVFCDNCGKPVDKPGSKKLTGVRPLRCADCVASAVSA